MICTSLVFFFISIRPGCNLCDNEPSFQQGDHIPIFPLPPVAVLKKCTSSNHHKCFSKALDKQLFQAHSVEELVVWLVEAESDVTLETYASQLGGGDLEIRGEEGKRKVLCVGRAGSIWVVKGH